MIDKKGTLKIVNETKRAYPNLPFKILKEKILGKRYVLSIVFIEDTKSKALNRTYRKKNKPTNILSFPCNKLEGELFVNLKQVKREQKLFKRSYKELVIFLLIHGMFHLKGYTHSSRMEAKEKVMRTFFGV